MDLTYSDEHEVFRREVQDFLASWPLSGDEGQPIVARDPNNPAAIALRQIAREVARGLAMRSMEAEAGSPADLNLAWKT